MEEATNLEEELMEERENKLIAETPKTDLNLYQMIKSIKRSKTNVGPLFNQEGCFATAKKRS